MEIYENPKYYEIAFSFVNSKKQVDLFEKFIKNFSKVKVRRFLDIACGPSLQLREIARKGYEAIGLDNSPQMLKYLQEKSKEEGLEIETVKADMNNFKLKKKVDFAFIMMGSLTVKSNDQFLKHLDSVANSLNKGGLYLIEDMPIDWTKEPKQKWVMKRGGITVETEYTSYIRDMLNQIHGEKIVLKVNDNGEKKESVHQNNNIKIIFPQEFKALVNLNGEFESIGWFERFEFKPLMKANNDNIVVLRKK